MSCLPTIPLWHGLLAALETPVDAADPVLDQPDALQLGNLFWTMAVVIVVIWLIIYLLDRFRPWQTKKPVKPVDLMAELVQGHGLRLAEEAFLKQAAEALSLKAPARLFIDPNLLQQYGQHWPQFASQAAQLQQRLFKITPDQNLG